MPGIPPRHRERFEAWLERLFEERKFRPRRNPVSPRYRRVSGPDPLFTPEERADIRKEMEKHYIARRGVLELGREDQVAFLHRENRWHGD